MFCNQCGAQNAIQGKFCAQCGAPMQAGSAAPAPAPANVVKSLMEKLNGLASTEKLEGFSLRSMFSEVFKKRTQEEIEDYFVVGTSRTTPSIDEVQTGWPRPWFFARVLLFVAILYGGFAASLDYFVNPKMLPGLMMTGALAVPLATLFLFFEWNTPRNVSFPKTLMLMAFGGIVSIFISLLGFQVANLDWLGASSAGIIEETGKLLTVILIVRGTRYRYILNGMLAGAAVGAGFAAFESAGYAFEALWNSRALDAMTSSIHQRALFAPFGHIPYTAISAGALWRVKGARRLELAHLMDPSFLKAFAIPVTLHMLWNSPLRVPFYGKEMLVGFCAWFVVFGLVQQGLRQVKREQIETVRDQLRRTGVNLQAMGAAGGR